jgi:hypothetical protein
VIKLKLNNLNSSIDPVILDRGRQYLLGGYVLKLEEAGHLVFRAEVEGSELYEVYIELNEDGTVLSSDCDCPYDFGPVCKHQAAVLLRLRDNTEVLHGPEADDLPFSQNTMKQLLEAESKESLVALLLSLMEDSDVVEQRVKLHISKAGGTEELEECRRLIRSYINTYADDHGFVTWRNTSRAVDGALMVSEKARAAADDHDWDRAVRISLCILEEMVALLQAADDSDGSVGGVIEESLEIIHEVTLHNELLSKTERETLFQMLLKESKHPRLNGWSDWQLAFLENASRLAVTAELRRQWDEHASRMISGEYEGGFSDRYFAERVAFMRYHIIQTYEGEERAREYLLRHLHFSKFRELAIRDAMEHGRHDEVIRLAEQGEKQDQAQGWPGLVKQWRQYRYEAYRRSGQIEKQRKLGEELVLDGDFSYYRQVKEAYPPAEWPLVYQRMLQKLEKDSWPRGVYTQILVEEQDRSRLLEYVKKEPSRIEEFYPHLKEQFSSEVKELFREHIMGRAGISNTRKHYQDVCRIIRMLRSAGGKEEAGETVRMLIAKYPNKPAFREELMKLDFQ